MKTEEIAIDKIIVRENFRTDIDNSNISELMSSIKQHGLKQPIGLCKDKGGKFSLLFGNRRVIACKKLGWTRIPAVVQDEVTGKDMVILNLTENIQRSNPSYVELGRGIEKLTKEMKMTPDEISIRLGIDKQKVIIILESYMELPAKHRGKVMFMGRGSKQKGKIPANVATRIIRLKKEYGLSEKHIDELLNYVADSAGTTEFLSNVALLLKAGLTVTDALAKMEDYSVYSISIVAHRLFISKQATEAGYPSVRKMLTDVLYGKAKPIAKPDFIK